MFNKDSLGRADFAIKNLKSTGEAEHGLEHSVEGVFSIDGKEIILKKIYVEKWAKARGKTKSEYTGNTTNHWINGVSVQKKAFTEQVKEIVGDEEKFRLLTSPTAFPALHWEQRRRILFEMTGEMTDDEIIATDSKLADLVKIKKDYTLNQLRDIIKARQTAINKEIEKIPVRIEENNRALPDITGLDKVTLGAELEVTGRVINEKKLELQGIDTGGKIPEISKKLNIARSDLNTMETGWHSEKMKAASDIDRQIKDIERDAQTAQTRISDINKEIDIHNKHIVGVDKELVELRKEYASINALKFQSTVKDACPTCRQALPKEQVRDVKNSAQAAFNHEKAEDRGNYIGVNFDDDKPGSIYNLHPTYEVEYKGVGKIRKMTRSQERYRGYISSEYNGTFAEYLGIYS